MPETTSNELLRSGRWFGSPARNNLVSAMLSAPKWKRKLRMLLSPRRTRLAQACNMVAADAFNRGDTETFELVLKRADMIWAEILWPNTKTTDAEATP